MMHILSTWLLPGSQPGFGFPGPMNVGVPSRILGCRPYPIPCAPWPVGCWGVRMGGSGLPWAGDQGTNSPWPGHQGWEPGNLTWLRLAIICQVNTELPEKYEIYMMKNSRFATLLEWKFLAGFSMPNIKINSRFPLCYLDPHRLMQS